MMRQLANRSRLILDVNARISTALFLGTKDCCQPGAVRQGACSRNVDGFEAMLQRGFATKKTTKSKKTAAPQEETDAAPAGGEQMPETSPSDVEALQAIIDQQNATADKKEAEVNHLKDSMLRTLADMENLRNRTARQIDQNKQFAVQGFAKNLLDVADSLERAAAAVPTEALQSRSEKPTEVVKHLQTLLEGVELTDKQLKAALKSSGVTKYEALGMPFDPNLHNALFEMPDPSKEPGSIGVVTKSGYMLNDKVLRAAEVGVVKKP